MYVTPLRNLRWLFLLTLAVLWVPCLAWAQDSDVTVRLLNKTKKTFEIQAASYSLLGQERWTVVANVPEGQFLEWPGVRRGTVFRAVAGDNAIKTFKAERAEASPYQDIELVDQ